MEGFILFIAFVFAIFEIALAFKLWGMCNDVEKIAKKLCSVCDAETPNTNVEASVPLDSIKVGDTVNILGTYNDCEVIKVENGVIWVNLNNKTVKYYPNEVKKV